jgi:hypothetical protein
MEALSHRLQSLASSLSSKSSPERPVAASLAKLRGRAAGVDDLVQAYADPTETLARCDAPADFTSKQERLATGLRSACKAELDQVAACLARLEEEATRRPRGPPVDVLGGRPLSPRRGDPPPRPAGPLPVRRSPP